MESNQAQPKFRIKSVSPMTFSQKMYRAENLSFGAEEIVEDYDLQTSTNSLDKVKNLLERIYLIAS